jgi:hypothetical protein
MADYMAWDPGMAIFSRFRSANMKNLLLLQTEVAELEEKLNDAIAEDNRSSNTDAQQYRKDWTVLRDKCHWMLCGRRHWN